MRVAFVLDDSKLSKYNSSRPEFGNPGIGGTQYCFISLANKIKEISETIEPIIFHYNSNAELPELVGRYVVSNDSDILIKAQKLNCDFIVVRGDNDVSNSILVNQNDIKVILWIHNHLSRKALNYIGLVSSVKHVVFCGREQRQLAYDTKCFVKSSTIFNMHYCIKNSDEHVCEKASVAYIGSVIPSKGLHRLIRLWPKIKERHSDAKLHVIGSGALYNKSTRLGSRGLAESKYEDKIYSYIKGDPCKFDITFHGLLGEEKYDVLNKCLIGIPNPTGSTECCPGSVLECSSAKLALVSYRKFGMVDTIKNGETGYLVDNDEEFINKVVELLKDKCLSEQLGANGEKFVRKNFSPSIIAAQWINVFDSQQGKLTSVVEENISLNGTYIYSWLIRNNRHGNNVIFSFLRDLLRKVESLYNLVR